MAVFKQLDLKDKTNANRIILHIDTAEPNKMRTNARKLGFPVNRVQLKIKGERFSFGDYLMGVRRKFALVGERKALADLVGSMWDKRFYRQMEYMDDVAQELRMIPLLLIVGSVREWRSKERLRIQRAFRKGKIPNLYEPLSITKVEDNITKAHIRVIANAPSIIIRHITNDIQLLRAFYQYGTGLNQKRVGGIVPREILGDKRYAFQISTLASILNIRESTAKHILDYYETLSNLIDTASEDELVYRIKGIGKINAKLLMKKLRWLKNE